MARRAFHRLLRLLLSRLARVISPADGPGFLYAFVDGGVLWKEGTVGQPMSVSREDLDGASPDDDEEEGQTAAWIDRDSGAIILRWYFSYALCTDLGLHLPVYAFCSLVVLTVCGFWGGICRYNLSSFNVGKFKWKQDDTGWW
ncbi:hypothetical protein GG344DRAFT_69802 [Lentinula edodes]|nr:hypothetical protein GG344DRAFT_69802 [Lentinula edodes]